MRIRTVLDGNAFYEIDEECLEKQEEQNRKDKEASNAVEASVPGHSTTGKKRGRE